MPRRIGRTCLSAFHAAARANKLGRLAFLARLKTSGRALAAKGERARTHAIEWVQMLPRLTTAPLEPDVHAHMVCGAAHSNMGFWAAWSLMRFLPNGPLVVHMDGDWDDAQIACFEGTIPGTRMIPEVNSDRAVAERVAPFPHIRRWRQSYRYRLKLVDPHLLATSQRMILFDSNVLFLHDPVELKGQVAGACRTFSWNSDLATYVAVDLKTLDEVSGGTVPRDLNSGLMVTSRFGEAELAVVDDILSRLFARGVDLTRLWLEQSVLAAVIGRIAPCSRPLPDGYDVVKGRTKTGQVARHYVGSPLIRPRFFTEGVPRLLSQIDGLA